MSNDDRRLPDQPVPEKFGYRVPREDPRTEERGHRVPREEPRPAASPKGSTTGTSTGRPTQDGGSK